MSQNIGTEGPAQPHPTERDTVDLVATGLTNPQIGQRLLISRETVKTHLAHIFAKLGARNRAELTALTIGHNRVAPKP
jgi:DNA-binding CsgD family transcriptional regulator